MARFFVVCCLLAAIIASFSPVFGQVEPGPKGDLEDINVFDLYKLKLKMPITTGIHTLDVADLQDRLQSNLDRLSQRLKHPDFFGHAKGQPAVRHKRYLSPDSLKPYLVKGHVYITEE